MDIQQVTTRVDLEAFHALETAAHDHDYLALPADPIEELVPLLEGLPRGGDLTHLYVGRRGAEVLGILTLTFHTLDNLQSAGLDLCVSPEHRREGVARELLTWGLEEARRQGRTRVFMEVPSDVDGSPAQAQSLMDEVGAKNVIEDYRRLLDLTAAPPGRPLPAPAGYRVLQWVDRCPDDVVDGVAYLMGRMSVDAPLGDMDWEPEVWDAGRYRDKEADALARNRCRVGTAVVHVASGHVAGMTDIGINRSRTDIAYQWDTIVDPSHRGKRLGMVLKSWNHQHLIEQVPDVKHVNTWNALSNTFMNAVNDELGYRPVQKWTEFQLDL